MHWAFKQFLKLAYNQIILTLPTSFVQLAGYNLTYFVTFADPKYVLTHYKTEQCRRPLRLCRQGYACPSYHNPRDKRRSPAIYKYRSAMHSDLLLMHTSLELFN